MSTAVLVAIAALAVSSLSHAQPSACAVFHDPVLPVPEEMQAAAPICPIPFGPRWVPPPPDVARGSIVLITGFNLGPLTPQTHESFPLTTDLAGVSVNVVTTGGAVLRAYVLYAQEHRVRAIIPNRANVGYADVVVTVGGVSGNGTRVRIVDRNPVLYTRLPRYNIAPDGAWQANRYTATARPGQAIVLWGTGLGPVEGNDAEGPPPAQNFPDVEVRVGLTAARVLYAGRSGCCAGMDQIVFEAPSGVQGCQVPVTVRVPSERRASTPAWIALSATGATCSDPHGMPSSVRQLQVENGRIRYGLLALGQYGWSHDGLSGYFYSTDEHSQMPLGTCGNVPGATRTSPLDAGTELRFRGPSGEQSVAENLDFNGELAKVYGLEFSSKDLAPADYVIHNGTGGRDVGAFEMPFAVTTPWFRLTDADAFRSMRLGEDLTIAWSGENPPNSYISISGLFLRFDTPNGTGLAGFWCLADAAKGRFTVPSWLLNTREADAATHLDIGITSHFRQEFKASGLDFGEFLQVRHEASVRVAIAARQ